MAAFPRFDEHLRKSRETFYITLRDGIGDGRWNLPETDLIEDMQRLFSYVDATYDEIGAIIANPSNIAICADAYGTMTNLRRDADKPRPGAVAGTPRVGEDLAAIGLEFYDEVDRYFAALTDEDPSES